MTNIELLERIPANEPNSNRFERCYKLEQGGGYVWLARTDGWRAVAVLSCETEAKQLDAATMPKITNELSRWFFGPIERTYRTTRGRLAKFLGKPCRSCADDVLRGIACSCDQGQQKYRTSKGELKKRTCPLCQGSQWRSCKACENAGDPTVSICGVEVDRRLLRGLLTTIPDVSEDATVCFDVRESWDPMTLRSGTWYGLIMPRRGLGEAKPPAFDCAECLAS